ncbi:POU domain class 2-associating factor 1 [Cheilinus undulatus]|uniref:POU domain class 2-associating factor 1 n=1 Tax=Cheilinus undulatus TaxID=241271 RepID=UPI001BD6AFF7|nr:POU domain class 2-associating factor 1 [Cheilinus undulatus]
MRNMHWEKSPPAALPRSRPYQGVRVRDPVKELLRRKRSLEPHGTKTAPPTVNVVAHNNQSSYTQGVFSSDAAGGSPSELSPAVSDGGQQCGGWKAAAPTTASSSGGLQAAVTPWALADYNQQDRSAAQTLAYTTTPTLPADVYMQTLCPSYTMLTYTHTPLLTNFGTIPVAPAPASLPQMELQDSGLAYLPWAPPLTTISTIPNTGVQFASGPAALPGSPLVHMPMSMSLTTMIPQNVDPQPQEPDPEQCEDPLDPDSQHQCLDEDPDVESEPPSLLDKLLEEQKNDGEEGKHRYDSSFFVSDD